MHIGTPFSLIDKMEGHFEFSLFWEFESIKKLMFHLDHNSYIR